MKWFGTGALALATFLPLVLGCAGARPPAPAPAPEAAPAPAGSVVRVAVQDADNLQYLSFWIALGAGYFKQEGLAVEVVEPPKRGASQFLLEGRAEVALLPPPKYLDLIGEEAPIVLFANLLRNEATNLLVRPEVAQARKLSPTAPLAERLKGLRGLRVGVAPGPPARLRILFAAAGMDIDRDLEVVTLGEERQKAFDGNAIDALYAHTPFLEKALVEQGAVLLVNQSRGEVPELASRQIHCLLATRQLATDNPKLLVAMTRAIYSAQRLVHADQKAAVDAVLASGVPGLERKKVETLVAIYEPAVPQTPEVSVQGIEAALRLFPSHRAAPDLSKVNLADYVAAKIAEEVVAGSPR